MAERRSPWGRLIETSAPTDAFGRARRPMLWEVQAEVADATHRGHAPAQWALDFMAEHPHAGPVLLERRTALQLRPQLVESATATAVGEARLAVRLIDAGEGSSGVYPVTTLQEAARTKVFHEGLHCYVDHPTQTEDFDRPERSVKDLAGCLATDAVYRDGGLYAEVRVFSSHRDFITERASTIGMSIRAEGELSERTTTGKPTVARLTEAHSVDFVTHAGRGGRIESWQ